MRLTFSLQSYRSPHSHSDERKVIQDRLLTPPLSSLGFYQTILSNANSIDVLDRAAWSPQDIMLQGHRSFSSKEVNADAFSLMGRLSYQSKVGIQMRPCGIKPPCCCCQNYEVSWHRASVLWTCVF
jgi:hypothetical protein